MRREGGEKTRSKNAKSLMLRVLNTKIVRRMDKTRVKRRRRRRKHRLAKRFWLSLRVDPLNKHLLYIPEVMWHYD